MSHTDDPLESTGRAVPDPLRDVDFPPRDEPLRLDVGLLGAIVGDVVREQGGDVLFERVEAARRAAIARREGREEADDQLQDTLCGLDATEAEELVRAFSTYFQVVNLAERVHRVRRGRAYMRDGVPQVGSLADTVATLRARGLDDGALRAAFDHATVEPVFTAHPTEATRRVVLDKQERIAEALLDRLYGGRTPHEEEVALARIRENITTAWQTEEHPEARPTVDDEREHVLYYVANALYQVLPALHERLDEALATEDAGSSASPRLLFRPGSWVGGDMDGNPNVDGDSIRATLHRHRALALDRYLAEVASLATHLTQSASRTAWSEDVDARTERYRAHFPAVAAAIPERWADMGYRVFLTLIETRLRATRDDAEHGYTSPADFLVDLDTVADSLAAHGGAHAGLFAVRRLLRRVRAFGFHLAALDVRQDARELRDVVAELIEDPAWPTRPAEERAARLRELLDEGAEATTRWATRAHALGGHVARELDVFAAIAEVRETYGPAAIGSYIISMAQDVDDVLTVMWLATVGGLADRAIGVVEPADSDKGDHTGTLPLDIAPLFETVPDLERAASVLDTMFTDPLLARHLDHRDRRQMVMVGYSDSNKDGGIASARWALQRALDTMAAAATRHDIVLTVFHGRGGTVSRGGGSVHRAVAAMPAASIGGRLRLTEQGEVIDAKYGLAPIALRNLERMLGSIVLREAGDAEPGPPPAWHALADTIASSARSQYRALVYDDERFTGYFRAGTPIDVIERMAIGSRPASRRSGAGVRDLRAIPWVFSWTQCRAMMTGWYGLGAGLEAAVREHGLAAMREAAGSWAFLDALLSDVEMVLAKSDIAIARGYRDLAPEPARGVFDDIEAEFERTVALLLDVREADGLLDDDRTLRRSIRLRNPYVDPMNILQVDLLARWREGGSDEGPLLDALLATVNGIARGLQNTG